MNRFRKFIYFASVMMLLTACSGREDEPQPVTPTSVSFKATIGAMSRATETAFENGDAISVFAVSPSSTISLLPSGNYVDNAKFVYDGNLFAATNNNITIAANDTVGLAYYAIYPYQEAASNQFVFSVNTDQSSHANYTNSDLCTSYCPPTASETVNLSFYHRLSNIVIKFSGENIASKKISVNLENVYVNTNIDINANTYTPTGNKTSVIMGEDSDNSYHAIIVPQSFGSEEIFMTVTIDDKEYAMSLSSAMEFKSGKQIVFEYEVQEDKIIELNGYINPWDIEDSRLETVVPEEIIEKIEEYMPLHTGINPPNVEGVYYIDPFVAVYCEDYATGNGYAPGTTVLSKVIRFANQNTTENTLDYDAYTSTTTQEGKGAFISGSGNDFTAFFNTSGIRDDGYTTSKTALVISGTKTESGIENLHYAFIMVEKYDPDDILMDEGVFRVFKDEDGLSVNSTWSRSALNNTMNKTFGEINLLDCIDRGK